jgi:hypothetical protein
MYGSCDMRIAGRCVVSVWKGVIMAGAFLDLGALVNTQKSNQESELPDGRAAAVPMARSEAQIRNSQKEIP